MPARQSVQDALSAIRAVAPVSGNKYGALLNADGSIQVTKNGAPLPLKVWWAFSGLPSRELMPIRVRVIPSRFRI